MDNLRAPENCIYCGNHLDCLQTAAALTQAPGQDGFACARNLGFRSGDPVNRPYRHRLDLPAAQATRSEMKTVGDRTVGLPLAIARAPFRAATRLASMRYTCQV